MSAGLIIERTAAAVDHPAHIEPLREALDHAEDRLEHSTESFERTYWMLYVEDLRWLIRRAELAAEVGAKLRRDAAARIVPIVEAAPAPFLRLVN